ncbi:nuclear condensing complex subunit [Linnemannia elongata]|nr:nuclear condensing complex subunit [Linnemannia elongata]
MARPKNQAAEVDAPEGATAGSSTSTATTPPTTTKPTAATKKPSKSRKQKQPVLETLRTVVPTIFQECQKSAANHRKNAIMLRKIQEQCAEAAGENGEAAFNKEFIRNLNVVLAIKKVEPTADRVVQFVSTFILCTCEKDRKPEAENMDQEDEDEDEESSISATFVEHLMRHLLKGITVKEKLVRVRCCKLIALSINSVGALENDLYVELQKSLMERTRDKESQVRVQALFALSKMQGNGDEEDDDEEEGGTIIEKFLDLLQHDPAAEVRRSAIFNIAQSKDTLPFILERARDTDTYNRRAVFTKPMSEIRDFRMLSIGDRERLLRYGLTDRDDGVKKACTKMLATKWINQADDNLIEFLERLDVMGSSVAEDVLNAFFDYRADVIDTLSFNDIFWVNLSVESSFLVRVFTEFCRRKDDDAQFDKVVPEVVRHAFYIQKYSNIMQQAEEEDRPEAEFIVTQLLMIARLLDYADEIGRRKMFGLLREMLLLNDLPDKHLECIVETMRKISLNEKDFTRIIIEIISDLSESTEAEQEDGTNQSDPDDDDSPDDMTMDLSDPDASRKRKHSAVDKSRRNSSAPVVDEADKARKDLESMLNKIRCLTITKYMLERSSEHLQESSYMFGLLNTLVVPALAYPEEVMQDLGLQCLGLICSLEKALAADNMDLFLTCAFAENASTLLHVLSVKIMFDLILTFGMASMSSQVGEERINADLKRALESEEPEVQAVAVEGIAKLMLTKVLRDAEILRTLIILYFDPATAKNNHLRQCLSYFLQVYFHSSYDNQVMLSEMAVPIMVKLIEMHQENKNEMPTCVNMGQQLLEWCEPRRGLEADPEKGPVNKNIDYGLQANIAIDIVKAMFAETAYVRRFLANILHKIPLDDDSGEIRLKKLTLLIGNLKTKRPIVEPSSKKNLLTVEKNILKMFSEAPEALGDDELAKLAELTDELSFVNKFTDPPSTEKRKEDTQTTKGPKTRARRGTSKAKEKEDKFKKMMDEVDAMLEGSSSEKEDTPQGDDSGSDIFDESDYNNDEDDDDE